MSRASTGTAKTVEAYLAAAPEAVRPRLARIRAQIRKAVPHARESISYAIPAYKFEGRPLLYFAAFKAHIGLYPMTGGIKQAFAEALAPYAQSKGTVRFAHDKPVPYALIGKLARYRADEITAAQKKPDRKPASKARIRTAAPVRAKGRRA